MATIGLKNIYAGLLGDDGNVVKGEDGLSETGVFAIDTEKKNMNLGSTQANITGLAGTVTKIWGNNVPVDSSYGKANPSVAIASNMINPTAKQKMLGRVKQGGGWIDGDKHVEVALLVESQSPITYQSVYFGFGRGNVTETAQNVQTNNDNETREGDNLTYSALDTSRWNNNPFKYWFADDKDFDLQGMFDDVFPGSDYDPTTGGTKSTAAKTGN